MPTPGVPGWKVAPPVWAGCTARWFPLLRDFRLVRNFAVSRPGEKRKELFFFFFKNMRNAPYMSVHSTWLQTVTLHVKIGYFVLGRDRCILLTSPITLIWLECLLGIFLKCFHFGYSWTPVSAIRYFQRQVWKVSTYADYFLVDLRRSSALHVGILWRGHLQHAHAECVHVHALVVMFFVHFRSHELGGSWGREEGNGLISVTDIIKNRVVLWIHPLETRLYPFFVILFS